MHSYYRLVCATAILSLFVFGILFFGEGAQASSYSLGTYSNLSIWDDTDPEGGSLSRQPNQNVTFIANYTNITDGVGISGASCNISFNVTPYGPHEMYWNSTSGEYNFNRTFPSSGMYEWNVSCNATGFDELNTTDNVTIQSYCGTLSTPDSIYYLYNNVSSTGTCFTISASNITLDCQGFAINFSTGGAGSTYGVYSNQDYTTLRDCVIEDGNHSTTSTNRHGIFFNSADNGSIENSSVSVYGNTAYGIYLDTSLNNTLINNTGSSETESGILLEASSNNTLISNIGTSDSGHGIYAHSSSDYNILINNTGSSDGSNTGITIFTSSYNILTNNTGTSNSSTGIYIYSSSDSNLTSNTGTSDTGEGIYLYLSSDNNLTSNTGISNESAGLSVRVSPNNTLISNIGTSDSGIGIYIWTSSDYNILINNTGSSDSSYGFYLYDSSDNNLTSNTGTSDSNIGIYIRSSSNYNTFNGTNATGAYGFYFRNSAHNNITNAVISGSTDDVYVDSDAGSFNNWFINCSLASDDVSVNGAGNNVTFARYIRANVSNSSGVGLSGATVTARDVFGSTVFSETTGSDGLTGWHVGIEFVQNSSQRIEYNNYTVNATLAGYYDAGQEWNISVDKTVQIEMDPITCGDTITESVTLASELYCTGQTALTIGADDVVLDCNGKRIRGDNTTTPDTRGVFATGRNNITIRNCVIEDFKDQILLNDVDNSTIYNNNVSSVNRYGIYLDSGSGLNNLTDNYAYSDISNAIRIEGSSNNTLISNTGESNTSTGILVYSSADYNTLINNTATSIDGAGLQVQSCEYNNFTSNTVESNTDYGGYVTASADYNTFTSNNITSNIGHGISITSSSNNTLISNTFTSSTNRGININACSNMTLINNTGKSNGTAYGISLDTVTNSTLINNTGISASSYGIYLFASSDYNTLTGNNGTSYASFGIIIINSDYNTLTDNTGTCYGANAGIRLTNINNSIFTSNRGQSSTNVGFSIVTSSGNNFTLNKGIGTSNSGIYIHTSAGNTFTSNTGESDTDNGIELYSSSNNTFFNTTGKSNTVVGIYIDSSSDYNTFNGTNATGAYGFYLRSSAHNNVTNAEISGSTDDVYVDSEAGTFDDWFINCSLASDDVTVTGATNNVTFARYIRANVSNSSGSGLSGAMVTAQDVFGSTVFSDTTGSDGLTGWHVGIEYMVNSSQRIEYNNYTVNATLAGYYDLGQEWNISVEQTAQMEMDPDVTPPGIEFSPPTPDDGNVTANEWVYVNVSVNESNEHSAFIDWNYSLMGWWSFEHTNSSGVFDNSSYSRFANFQNGLGEGDLASGMRGQGLELDGNNDYIVGDFSRGTTPVENNTLSVWIYPLGPDFGNQIQGVITVMNGSNNDNAQINMQLNSSATGVVCLSIMSGGAAQTNYCPIELQEWVLVTCTFEYDGSAMNVSMYIDGAYIESGSYTSASYQAGADGIYTGVQKISNNRYLNGTIDDVMVWNRALSPEEINASYDAGLCRLERNFTGLSDGEYNYTAYAIDKVGNENQTEWRTVSIETTDTTPPLIDFISPTQVNGTEAADKDYITWNVSVSENISLCYVDVNQTNQTGTVVNATSESYCWYNETGLVGNVTRCAVAHAADGEGNWNTTLEMVCRSTNEQQDVTDPTFSGHAREPDPPNEDQDVVINVTVTESSLDTVLLDWNYSQNYTVTTSVGDEYYFTVLSGNYTAHDVMNYTWYANDTSGNMNSSAEQSFTVANQQPGQPSLTAPGDGSGIATQNVTFSYSSTDGDGEDSLTYYITINGSLNDSTGSTSIDINFSDGGYNWSVTADDGYQNSTASVTRYFEIDTITPTISIASPDNISYTTTSIQLNVSASEVVDSWWYELNSNGTNVSFSPNSSITGVEGLNNITVWANDTIGNEGFSGVWFSVDSTPPSDIYTIPNTPANGSFTNLNWFGVNVTFTELYPDSCIVDMHNGTNYTMARTGNTCYRVVGANEGSWNYSVWVNDTSGNLGWNGTWFVTVDMTDPVFSGHVINPDPPNEDQDVMINVTVTEDNVDTVILQWNESDNYTVSASVGDEYYSTVLSGNFTAHDTMTYRWYANDSAGNVNLSGQEQFIVANQQPSQPSLSTPEDGAKITTQNVTFSYSSTDGDGEDSLTYYITINGSLNDSTGSTSIDINFSDGGYNWSVTADDGYQNSTASVTRYFIIDATPPGIAVDSPLNQSYVNQSIDINVTTEEGADSCLYSLDGGTNYSLSNDSMTNWFTVNQSVMVNQSTYQLFVYCNDTVGNLGMNDSVWFTYEEWRDVTPPSITVASPGNTSYNYTSIQLNVSASEAADSWWYELNSNGTNVSFSPNSSITGAEGLNNITVWANDTIGNEGFSGVWFSVDTTAPVITGVGNGTVTESSAVVEWNTSEASTSVVHYSTNQSNLSFTSSSGSLVTEHSRSLSSLSSNSTYYYNVSSCDAIGNCNTSGYHNFTTEPVCVENWTYGSWSECIDDWQTRSATDLNSCGTTDNRSAVGRECESDDGGGGGGGGGATITTPSRYSFEIDETVFNIKVKQGETMESSFTVSNEGTAAMSMVVSIYSGKDIIHLKGEESFRLGAGEESTRKLSIVAPLDTEPGAYICMINVTGAGVTKSVRYIIDVQSREALFDVTLNMPDDYKIVDPGSEIVLQVRVMNLGDVSRVDAEAVYKIMDVFGNVLYTEKETFAVETQSSLIKSLKVPEGLAPGKYIATVEVLYRDSVATSSTEFEVGKSGLPGIMPTYMLIIAALLIQVVTVVLILAVRSMYRKNKSGGFTENAPS